MEKAIAKLCRVSMDRVVTWHIQKASTDDLGWASALRGEDTVELIKACISVSQNRRRLAQALLSCVDLLASAAQSDRAADLRIYLRKASLTVEPPRSTDGASDSHSGLATMDANQASQPSSVHSGGMLT